VYTSDLNGKNYWSLAFIGSVSFSGEQAVLGE